MPTSMPKRPHHNGMTVGPLRNNNHNGNRRHSNIQRPPPERLQNKLETFEPDRVHANEILHEMLNTTT